MLTLYRQNSSYIGSCLDFKRFLTGELDGELLDV